MEDTKKNSWFVRFLVIVLIIFLLAMVAYAFYMPGEGHAKITEGAITALCLAIILCLSEAFDNFSIGKVFQISRELKKKEGEVIKLEERNTKLFDSIANIVSATQNQAQTQSNSFHGHFHAPPVQPGTDQDIAAAVQGKIEQSTSDSPVVVEAVADAVTRPSTADEASEAHEQAPSRAIDWEKLEALAIEKHSPKISSKNLSVMRDVKLVPQFSGVDPVSDEMPLFDGFVKDGEREIFMEVRNSRTLGPNFRSGLYLKLSKLYHYRAARRVNAYLDLLLIRSNSDRYSETSQEKLYRDFYPALNSGLLRVHDVDLTDEEINACLK